MIVWYEIEVGEELIETGFDFSGHMESFSEGNSEFSHSYNEFVLEDIDFDNPEIKSSTESDILAVKDYIAKNRDTLKEVLAKKIYNNELGE